MTVTCSYSIKWEPLVSWPLYPSNEGWVTNFRISMLWIVGLTHDNNFPTASKFVEICRRLINYNHRIPRRVVKSLESLRWVEMASCGATITWKPRARQFLVSDKEWAAVHEPSTWACLLSFCEFSHKRKGCDWVEVRRGRIWRGWGTRKYIFFIWKWEDALWIRISKLDLPPLLTPLPHLSIFKLKYNNKIIWFYIWWICVDFSLD